MTIKTIIKTNMKTMTIKTIIKTNIKTMTTKTMTIKTIIKTNIKTMTTKTMTIKTVSQNNIRNNQNFNICNTIRRHCSTNNINRNVEPGGSTLSRSIFAFLENRDKTNVDSNPTKTSMNLKNSAQGKFSNWPNASPLAA